MVEEVEAPLRPYSKKRWYTYVRDWPQDWQEEFSMWKAIPWENEAARRALWDSWGIELKNQVWTSVNASTWQKMEGLATMLPLPDGASRRR